MFYCYKHNWSDIYQPCPLCQPQPTITVSNSCTVNRSDVMADIPEDLQNKLETLHEYEESRDDLKQMYLLGRKDQNKDLESLREENARLVKALESAISYLKHYASGRRDQSFDGWELEWREVEIKSESDYAYYPNHVDRKDILILEQALAARKE